MPARLFHKGNLPAAREDVITVRYHFLGVTVAGSSRTWAGIGRGVTYSLEVDLGRVLSLAIGGPLMDLLRESRERLGGRAQVGELKWAIEWG